MTDRDALRQCRDALYLWARLIDFQFTGTRAAMDAMTVADDAGIKAAAAADAVLAQPDHNAAALSRFHHLMHKHGLHPGRTDDDLLDILDRHLSRVAQPEQEPVATLYVGSYFGDELEDWEIVANQSVCDRLNEDHIGAPTIIKLYAHSAPTITLPPEQKSLRDMTDADFDEAHALPMARPEQEPVAWLRDQRGVYEGKATLAPLLILGYSAIKPHDSLHGATYSPLYAAPVLSELSDEELPPLPQPCVFDAAEPAYTQPTAYTDSQMRAYARAVLAAAKEKKE